MSQLGNWIEGMKPFLAVIFLQCGLAGMDILSKAALNAEKSSYVLAVYRQAVATIVFTPFAVILERRLRPRMTKGTFIKLLGLALLEPIINQNFYYLGMKNTTATFTACMWNILPATTFLLACLFRLESFEIKSIRTQAKLFGTIATVGGAIIMTLLKGPVIEMMWRTTDSHVGGGGSVQHPIKGALMITAALFMILQAHTLKEYPAELSLTAWVCFLGTIGDAVVALVMEKGQTTVWALHWDTNLLAVVYSGLICSGLGYYIQGVVMRMRGPVFVTAFNPLSMVIVAILGSIILAEQMFLARLLGAAVIVGGLYLVVWGKAKDEDEELPGNDDDHDAIIELPGNDGNE